jgi:hypothetical protein
MNKFAVFKNLIRANEVLQFPEFLLISRNHFHLEWMMRRYIYTYVNIYLYMHIYVYIYIYMYTNIYI